MDIIKKIELRIKELKESIQHSLFEQNKEMELIRVKHEQMRRDFHNEQYFLEDLLDKAKKWIKK